MNGTALTLALAGLFLILPAAEAGPTVEVSGTLRVQRVAFKGLELSVLTTKGTVHLVRPGLRDSGHRARHQLEALPSGTWVRLRGERRAVKPRMMVPHTILNSRLAELDVTVAADGKTATWGAFVADAHHPSGVEWRERTATLLAVASRSRQTNRAPLRKRIEGKRVRLRTVVIDDRHGAPTVLFLDAVRATPKEAQVPFYSALENGKGRPSAHGPLQQGSHLWVTSVDGDYAHGFELMPKRFTWASRAGWVGRAKLSLSLSPPVAKLARKGAKGAKVTKTIKKGAKGALGELGR